MGAPRLSAVFAVLTVLLAAAAAVSGYARTQLVDEHDFADRAASALDSPDVRQVVAEQLVDGLAGSVSPNLLAVRPLLTPAVASVVGSQPFRRVFRRAVAARHARLTTGSRGVTFELVRGGALLLDAARGISPRVAAALPPSPRPDLLELEPRGFELTIARWITKLARWWWPLLAATLLAAAATAALAGSVRHAFVLLGVTVTLAGLVVATLVWALGDLVVSHASAAVGLDEAHERDAFGAIWTALFGDLRTAALVAALGGAAVATLATGRGPRRLVRPAARKLGALWGSPHPVAHAARIATVAGAGLLLLLEPALAWRAVTAILGVVLVLAAVASASSWIGGELSRREERSPEVRLGRLVAAIAGVVVVLTVVAIVVILPAPRAASIEAVLAPAGGCNGSRSLCARRLDEVVFPGTHNSYAAADEPGWFFANQRHGIARQLRDGIRSLLVDVHYGVRDERRGRVRTDLAYEGSSRNKVARELGAEGLRTAEAVAGSIGVGDLEGPRRTYMCHTLCELGAEPLEEQLGILRRFLDENPGEVVLMFVEPYVPVGPIEDAMRETACSATRPSCAATARCPRSASSCARTSGSSCSPRTTAAAGPGTCRASPSCRTRLTRRATPAS